jgi:hypothetical protein
MYSILFFLNDLLATGGDLREVDLAAGDLDAELVGVVDLSEDVRGTQDGLRGNTGVVQAPSADLVLLDDGGLHPELGGADRRDVTTRPGADNDAVKLLGHKALTLARD